MERRQTGENEGGSVGRRVERLVVLPFFKSLEIALKSIRVRFFRSLITTLSLVLAISFLCFVHIGNDVANGLLATGDAALRQELIRSGFDIGPETAQVDSSPKQKWIVFLSLLVCVVGIVNAQLMAVTERFREIGTMKCLGALDRFVLRIFMLEAGIQGLAGALAGALAGSFFALANSSFHFGMQALSALSWPDAAVSFFMAVGTGVGLSLLGVLYPAFRAAKMRPVEAMRIEE